MRAGVCYRVTGAGHTWYVEHNIRDVENESDWVLHKFEMYTTAEEAAEVIGKKLAGFAAIGSVVGIVKAESNARPQPVRQSEEVRKGGTPKKI